MNILITGATGFIGNNLCSAALSQNHLIRAVVRSSSNTHQLSPEIELIPIESITSPIPVTALQGIDTIIHLAARAHILNDRADNPEAEFFKVNAQGTINLAKAAISAGVKHFIFISSIGAMTTLSEEVLTETSPCNPDTPYGRSKLKAEEGLIELAQDSRMSWTIIRPTLVYGAGNPGNMKRLLKLIDTGLPLPFGAINNSRSFTYVGNLVDAIITCIDNPAAKNQTFLISDGEDLSTPELIRRLAHHTKKSVTLLPIPTQLLNLLGKLTGQTSTLDRLLGSLTVNSSHIQTTLNWKPPFTVDEGLRETVG
jgi:nucleoside-diphosphate-sugar epimerase